VLHSSFGTGSSGVNSMIVCLHALIIALAVSNSGLASSPTMEASTIVVESIEN
jgi:hypothetical protein